MLRCLDIKQKVRSIKSTISNSTFYRTTSFFFLFFKKNPKNESLNGTRQKRMQNINISSSLIQTIRYFNAFIRLDCLSENVLSCGIIKFQNSNWTKRFTCLFCLRTQFKIFNNDIMLSLFYSVLKVFYISLLLISF